METKLVKYSRAVYNKLLLELHCSCLFVKNLLLIRTLKVNSVALYDRVVIKDNQIEILWSLSGCYKIVIKGIGAFPGNTHGLKFQFTNHINPIEIAFYGVAKNIKKDICVENMTISVLKDFRAFSEVPITAGLSFGRSRFNCVLSKEHLMVREHKLYIKF